MITPSHHFVHSLAGEILYEPQSGSSSRLDWPIRTAYSLAGRQLDLKVKIQRSMVLINGANGQHTRCKRRQNEVMGDPLAELHEEVIVFGIERGDGCLNI